MFALIGVLLVALNGHAEISSVLESKATLKGKSSTSIFRPRVDWLQRSQAPVTGSVDGANEFYMENYLGLQYKVAKKHKVGLRVAHLHTLTRDGKKTTTNDEIGDAHIRWVDSSLNGLFNDQLDIVLTHKFYIPMRERSLQRGEITHYKGWAAAAHKIAPRWTLLANVIPTFYAFRRPEWRKPNGDARANVFYDVTTTGQLMYEVYNGWYASAEFGWGRREYLKLEGHTERNDIFPHGISVTYAGDNIEVAMGVASEAPTNSLTFREMRLLDYRYAQFFLETTMRVF